MFLKSITLQNVRSIANLHIDFSSESGTRRWTILLGENGCGKSSVLKSIALLLSGSEGFIELLENPDAWIRVGQSFCTISGVLQTANGAEREVELSMQRGESQKDVFIRNAASMEAVDRALAHSSHNYFVAGYGVSRRPPERGEKVYRGPRNRISRARNVSSLFTSNNLLISIEDWAMELDYENGKEGLQIVQKTLDALLPGMEFKGVNKQNRTLMFATEDGSIPFRELSDGYQSMASWCGDLLYSITQTFPKNRDPLKARGVLLIDELDLHLHPTWRRRLIEFLDTTFPNLQVIATTHSALTAQQCREGELYVIRRSDDKHLPELIPFQGEPSKMMLHQLLMSPMFGLNTLDSVEMEDAKNKVRKLSGKKSENLTSREKITLRTAKEKLKEMPRWDLISEAQKKNLELIEEINKQLQSSSAKATISKEKIQAKLAKTTKIK